ncbi:MAG: hypothetical protein HYX87_08315 [Chloroflexi bacterium]|nr:hypothetical protein [Chloroflexota bacterium]
MSQLVDKLKRITEDAVPALGFRSATRQAKSQGMLLIAMLNGQAVAGASNIVQSGVDALLIKNASAASMSQVGKVADGRPWGIALGENRAFESSALRKAGCDFVVFDPESPVHLLGDADLGKVLTVSSSPDRINALRGVDKVGVEIFLLDGGESEFISVRFLMACYFMADAARKPVLASVPARIASDEVRALWEAGVDAVVVQGDAGALKQLRQIIDTLPARTRRRHGKEAALIPNMATPVASNEEEEGDDE